MFVIVIVVVVQVVIDVYLLLISINQEVDAIKAENRSLEEYSHNLNREINRLSGTLPATVRQLYY